MVKVIGDKAEVRGSNGEEVFIVEASSEVMIVGNRGAKHYIITPYTSDGVTIVIKDFDEGKGDVLDLSQWSYSSTSLSYSTVPLTFTLQPQNIDIVLSSHASYDISATSILYPSSESSSSTVSSDSSVAGLNAVVWLFSSWNVGSVVGLLIAFTFFSCIIANYSTVKKKIRKEVQHNEWPKRREREYIKPAPLLPPTKDGGIEKEEENESEEFLSSIDDEPSDYNLKISSNDKDNSDYNDFDTNCQRDSNNDDSSDLPWSLSEEDSVYWQDGSV